jgi:hypothetical protein
MGEKLKKIVTLAVTAMMVLSMGMVTAPRIGQAADAEAGDLIKMEGLSSVYYLGDDDKRYVFPNENTYFSWYGDFSSVVTISQSELESYPLGGNVTIRPGTYLVKITTDPKVYAVEKGGVLRHIPNENTARTLYGDNWADKVVDVPDSFFVNYTIDEDNEVESDTYPQGTLVKPAGDNKVYYIDEEGEARHIKNESVFNANRFQWRFIVEAGEDYDLPEEGSQISSAEEALFDPSQRATADSGEELTVALASNTPASASIPAGGDGDPVTSLVPFASFNFTASDDGSVIVEDITLTKIGVGNRDGLGKVYIYSDNERLTRGRTLNTDGEVTFGLDHIISAGDTETLTVRADISGDRQSGNYGFAIQQAGDIETGGALVSGSFPIQGNIMSLADVESATISGSMNDGNDLNDLKVGEQEQALVDLEIVEESGEESVLVYSIAFTNRGSVDMKDLSNFILVVDGETVAELESSDSDYLVMELDEPYEVENRENFILKADIDRGAGDTVRFELDDITDIMAVGGTYGYGPGLDASGIDPMITPGTGTIATSDFSITEASDNPGTQDVAIGEDDVVFLIAELNASTEGVIVEELAVEVNYDDSGSDPSSNDYLENLSLYLDGSRVAGPMDINLNESDTSVSVTVDEEFEVEGRQYLTVRADITDDADTGRYSMTIDSDNMEVEDMDGNQIDGDEINGKAEGNDVRVGLDEPFLSKDGIFGGKNVVAGSEELKIGQFILEAGKSEDLDINSYNIKIVPVSGSLDSNDFDNLYVNDESPRSVSLNTVRSFSVNETLAKDGTKRISIYVDLDRNIPAGAEFKTQLSVDAEGAVSGDDVTGIEGFDGDYIDGQTMTVASGDLAVNIGAGTPSKRILVAGSEDVKVAEFEFSAENDSYNITEMDFAIVDENDDLQQGLVTHLKVNNGNYRAVTNGTVSIGDDIRVESDEDETIEVRVRLNDDFNAIDSGDELYVALTGYEYRPDSTGVTQAVDSNATTTRTLAVYNTELTVSTSQGSAVSWGNTWRKIMDIEFAADEADRATVKKLTVNVDPLGGTVTGVRLVDSGGDTVALSDGLAITGSSNVALTLNNPDADGRIAAGNSETFTVEINASDVSPDDSVVVELLDTGFEWSDNEASSITDHLDLIDKLSGSYELVR